MFFDKHRFSEMFHVKQFVFILLLSFIICICNTKSVFASSQANYDTVLDGATLAFICIDNENGGNYSLTVYYGLCDTVNIYGYNNSLAYSLPVFQNGMIYDHYIGIEPINYTGDFTYSTVSYNVSGSAQIRFPYSSTFYILKGNIGIVSAGNHNINIQYLTKKPWYENIWSNFKGIFENGSNWINTQISNIGTIVNNWWYDITHGSHGGSHSFGNKYLTVNQATPTPIPTITPRPTQIPYSTILQDDGNGNTTIMYQYNNPQGTPTASPYNPNQYTYYNTDINITGGDRNNPIYVQDVGNVNFSDLIDIANNSIEVNIGDLDSSTDMFTVPLEETAENIGEAVSGFSALPDDLFIIIGCIACIPLIAGIIGRLLK